MAPPKGKQSVVTIGGTPVVFGSGSGSQSAAAGAPVVQSESAAVASVQLRADDDMVRIINALGKNAAAFRAIWTAAEFSGFSARKTMQTMYHRCAEVFGWSKDQTDEYVAEMATIVFNRGVALEKAHLTMEENDTMETFFTRKEQLSIFDNLEKAGEKTSTTLTVGRIIIAYAPISQYMWNMFGLPSVDKADPDDISGLPLMYRWNGSQGFIPAEYSLNALIYFTRFTILITGDKQGKPTRTPFDAWLDVVKFFNVAQNGEHPYKALVGNIAATSNQAKIYTGRAAAVNTDNLEVENVFNQMFPNKEMTFNTRARYAGADLTKARTIMVPQA